MLTARHHVNDAPGKQQMSKILFFVPFGMYLVHNQLDALLAVKLRAQGAEPLIARCDGLYEHCDILAWAGEERASVCRSCRETGDKFFEAFGLPSVQLRNYLNEPDHAEAQRWAESLDPGNYLHAAYDSLPIGHWVISSIFSYFRITDKGLALPEVRHVHKSFLKSGLLTYWAVERLITEYAPDSMVIFNGRFAPYRVAFEASQRLRIKEITHERGYYDDSFILFDNCNCLDSGPIFDIYELWKDHCLSTAQLSTTQRYLQNRECGVDLNYPSYYEFSNEFYTIRHLLHIPEDAKVLVVFTSGESEAAYSSAYSEVTTQFDRIDELIELYRHRQDYLIIRHHPHMAGNAQEPPENYYITRAYQQSFNAPANVRVIMPSELINSYALLRNVNGVISFFSSIGYEAAGRGVGTAALAQAPFNKAMRYNISHRSENLADLIAKLFEQTDMLDSDDFIRAFRFIYAYIYRLAVQFTSFGIKNSYEMDIRVQSADQLADGFDPELDRICGCVLNRTPIMKAPGNATPDASPREEEQFFDEYINSIRDQRQQIQRKSRLYSASRLEPAVAVIQINPRATDRKQPFPNWQNRSRYKNFVIYECAIPSGDQSKDFWAEISAVAASIKEEYVMIAHPVVYYDEAFVSSAVERLLNDVTVALKGVFSGAWVQSQNGYAETEIFTKRVPVPDLTSVATINPDCFSPLLLLSLTVFRKCGIIETIDTISTTAYENRTVAALDTLLRDPGIDRTFVPLALIAHA
jgi:hypothetical protein